MVEAVAFRKPDRRVVSGMGRLVADMGTLDSQPAEDLLAASFVWD